MKVLAAQFCAFAVHRSRASSALDALTTDVKQHSAHDTAVVTQAVWSFIPVTDMIVSHCVRLFRHALAQGSAPWTSAQLKFLITAAAVVVLSPAKRHTRSVRFMLLREMAVLIGGERRCRRPGRSGC